MAELPPTTHRPLLTKESKPARAKDWEEQKRLPKRETTPEPNTLTPARAPLFASPGLLLWHKSEGLKLRCWAAAAIV